MADIRLEVADENQIQEILYDGTEIHQQPPSMSENLTQLARKIDFGLHDNDEATSDEKEEEEDKPFQQAHWPFENIRNKIRNSLTEICVLHDVIQIVKDKRYMILDQVQAAPQESKSYMQFLSVKRSLNNAANILLTGAETLRTSQAEGLRGRPYSDFHIELLKLRQNWRLKKLGDNIIGDLSYKTAGSSFKQTGIFEVTKNDDNDGPNAILPSAFSQNKPSSSSIKLQVSAELEGHCYMYVTLKKDGEEICTSRIQNVAACTKDGPWQQRLEAAQNVLFCKELFNLLAKEAVTLQPPIPHMVVGDQITSTIFPGIHLTIGLCYSDLNKKKPQPTNPSILSGNIDLTTSPFAGIPTNCHNDVLEHSLHQLLHKTFHNSSSTGFQQSSYGYAGVPPKRRFAGPLGTQKDELVSSMESEYLLDKIIGQAQHYILKLRTMYVIDQLSVEIKDPLIIAHWNLFNSPTQSSVRINIVTQGYDSVLRTTLIINVHERVLSCICRDGKVMTLSFEPQELKDLLFIQICQHTVSSVQCFSRFMGWSVISSENCIGVGTTEPLGNASAVILTSPNGSKAVSVRCGPKTGTTVAVSSSPRNDFYPSDVVHDRRWEHLGGSWNEVNIDKMEGRNFLNKIELLLAALTTQT